MPGSDRGRLETKGEKSEGLESCRELYQSVGDGEDGGVGYIRKDYAAILSSPAGMLPGLSAQLKVDCATDAVINDALRIDPCVDNQAGAGFEIVRAPVLVCRVESVEEGGGRYLRGRIPRSRCRGRRRRVDGHAGVVDETHVCGLRRVAPSVDASSNTIARVDEVVPCVNCRCRPRWSMSGQRWYG